MQKARGLNPCNLLLALLLALPLLAGCGGSSDSSSSSSSDSASSSTEDSEWLVNTTETSNHISGNPLVNVQSVESDTVNGTSYTVVNTTGIPDYSVTLDQADIDFLGHPDRTDATDYSDSSGPSVSIGLTVAFGQDVGFATTSCSLGYWPPGPACPTDQQRAAYLPASAEPETGSSCETGLNEMGVMLNGTAVYNWEDGASFDASEGAASQQNGDGVWHSVAGEFEVLDVDLCLGHAPPSGDYHHHTHSQCLAQELGDDGSGHSPVYGYAADGYPIHGPWYADGVYAKSAWVARDYSDPTYGCGSGNRTCQFDDELNPDNGTHMVAAGPDPDGTVDSISSHTFDAVSGLFYEDYYYDSSITAQDEGLDEHNGHDHDDHGYHYHMTVEADGDTFDPVFPYHIGPTFYGTVPADGMVTCGS